MSFCCKWALGSNTFPCSVALLCRHSSFASRNLNWPCRAFSSRPASPLLSKVIHLFLESGCLLTPLKYILLCSCLGNIEVFCLQFSCQTVFQSCSKRLALLEGSIGSWCWVDLGSVSAPQSSLPWPRGHSGPSCLALLAFVIFGSRYT